MVSFLCRRVLVQQEGPPAYLILCVCTKIQSRSCVQAQVMATQTAGVNASIPKTNFILAVRVFFLFFPFSGSRSVVQRSAILTNHYRTSELHSFVVIMNSAQGVRHRPTLFDITTFVHIIRFHPQPSQDGCRGFNMHDIPCLFPTADSVCLTVCLCPFLSSSRCMGYSTPIHVCSFRRAISP